MTKSSRLLLQLTGAQGTGKSTLLREFQRQVAKTISSTYIGEVSRDLLANKEISYVDTKADAASQLKITAELMARYYRAIGSDARLILAERSPICCLAYTNALEISSRDRQNLSVFTDSFIYDTVFRRDITVVTVYVPPTIPFVDDGVRQASTQGVVDKYIQDILVSHEIPYFTLSYTALETRLSFLHRILESILGGVL